VLSGLGQWVNPATDPQGPQLPDAQPSGAGGGNLYLPDRSRATLNLVLLGYPRVDRFAMQVEIFVPNLRPLGLCHGMECYGVECCGCPDQFAFCHYPGNLNHLSGICARGETTLGILGDLGNCRQMLWDSELPNASGPNDLPGPLWLCEQYADACNTRPVPPYNDFPVEICWWNQWITVYIDYNWTSPGRIISWARVPWTGGRHDPRFTPTWPWQQVIGSGTTGREDPYGPRLFTSLFVGCPGDIMGRFSWTQCQFDNVKLALGAPVAIPEICDNGMDDDLDGLVDCQDPDCERTPSCPCNLPFADFDNDDDVDQADFGLFQRCLTGSFGGVPGGCECADRPEPAAGDGDVDQEDLERFLNCFSGGNVQADPYCDH
jgi:hypothetical protein